MEGISDIKMIGLDPRRPPVLNKAPYIDLNFELSHEVPAAWAEDFNGSMSKHKFPAKIGADKRLFIETWVRSPDDVSSHFDLLKTKIAECNERFIARVEASREANASSDEAEHATRSVRPPTRAGW